MLFGKDIQNKIMYIIFKSTFIKTKGIDYIGESEYE